MGGQQAQRESTGAGLGAVLGGVDPVTGLDQPDSIPHIDTTGHFGVYWHLLRGWTARRYDTVDRAGEESVTATSYETRGGVPGLSADTEDGETVVVFVHGFGYGYEDARTLVGAYGDWLLAELDDTAGVSTVGYTYDAGPIRTTAAQTTFDAYLDIARQNGPKLARAVADMQAAGVENVHLVGHSMGGAVAAAAVAQEHVNVTVAGLHLLGAAEHASRFSDDGRYADRLRARATHAYNYHHRGDTMLGTWFRLNQGRRAVGAGPVDADHIRNVAVSPTSHGAFPKPAGEGGVMDRVASAISDETTENVAGPVKSKKRALDTAE